MSNDFQPAQPVDATSTDRGLISAIAQTIAGIKTFIGAVVLSAGLTINGAVNQMVKISPPATVSGQNFTDPTMWFQLTALNQPHLIQFGSGVSSTTWELALGFYGSAGSPIISTRGNIFFSAPSGGYFAPIIPGGNDLGTTSNYWRRLNLSEGVYGSNSSFQPQATLARVQYSSANCDLDNSGWTLLLSSVALARWTLAGRADLKGADRSATVGADTQNNPSGINTIASGATSVTITNSLVPNPATTKIRLNITWRGDPGSRFWWTQGTGTITVNLSAAAPANVSFDWDISGLL